METLLIITVVVGMCDIILVAHFLDTIRNLGSVLLDVEREVAGLLND